MVNVVAVIGMQWGDEGKGKLVDALAARSRACARYNGGANAGHTLVVEDKKVGLHLLPCGILHPTCTNIIGNGVVVDLKSLAAEIDQAEKFAPGAESRVVLSTRAHLTFKFHMLADASSENSTAGTSQNIGTTRKGIGQSYASKALRISLRACDMLKPWDVFEARYMREYTHFARAFDLGDFDPQIELKELKQLVQRLKPLVKDCILTVRDLLVDKSTNKIFVDNDAPVHTLLESNHNIIVEGANAVMLDLNVGTYPYCTSSDVLPAGVGAGLGISPKLISKVVGVVKAYTTRVGSGPFPSELAGDQIGAHLQKAGAEFGVTTGRLRRCGWLDLACLEYSCFIIQPDCLMLTKLDVLDDVREIKVAVAYRDRVSGDVLPAGYFPADLDDTENLECVYESLPGWMQSTAKITKFEQLPPKAQDYVCFIEKKLKTPITFIGTGPAREDIIVKY